MKNIRLNNRLLLDDLDKLTSLVKDELYKDFDLTGKNFTDDQACYWTGENYLREVIRKGKNHDGFPAWLKSYNLQHNTMKIASDRNLKRTEETLKLVTDVRQSLQLNFAFRHNALFSIYPPGGFISWHNNANASAFNMIFTWSETGDGKFTFLDRRKKQLVVIPDSPGWQCKYGYFGSYQDPEEDLVYHSAITDCWRMTVAFTFDRSETSKEIQNSIIEDIESEFV